MSSMSNRCHGLKHVPLPSIACFEFCRRQHHRRYENGNNSNGSALGARPHSFWQFPDQDINTEVWSVQGLFDWNEDRLPMVYLGRREARLLVGDCRSFNRSNTRNLQSTVSEASQMWSYYRFTRNRTFGLLQHFVAPLNVLNQDLPRPILHQHTSQLHKRSLIKLKAGTHTKLASKTAEQVLMYVMFWQQSTAGISWTQRNVFSRTYAQDEGEQVTHTSRLS